MPSFGRHSREALDTAHEDLKRLFQEVVKHYDCTVLEGFRNEEDQNKAYDSGNSQLRFPSSKHNQGPPCRAVDVVPYFSTPPHIRWNDEKKFYQFSGFVQGVATQLGIKLRWGGNWDMDEELHDSSFIDLPHYELYP